MGRPALERRIQCRYGKINVGRESNGVWFGVCDSGKTYTLQGSTAQGGADTERGVVPRALEYIISSRDKMRALGWEVGLEVSVCV